MTAPPRAPYLDPRQGQWLFDSSTLINADAATGLLPLLMQRFAGRAHLVREVLEDELDQGATGPHVRAAAWFTQQEVIGLEALKRLSTFAARVDRGEAATLVIAEANGWTAVLDDGAGYRLALDEHIRVTRTPQLLVTAVRAGWWSSRQAWEAYRALIAAGRRSLGPMPWAGWEEFDALCHTYTYDP